MLDFAFQFMAQRIEQTQIVYADCLAGKSP